MHVRVATFMKAKALYSVDRWHHCHLWLRSVDQYVHYYNNDPCYCLYWSNDHWSQVTGFASRVSSLVHGFVVVSKTLVFFMPRIIVGMYMTENDPWVGLLLCDPVEPNGLGLEVKRAVHPGESDKVCCLVSWYYCSCWMERDVPLVSATPMNSVLQSSHGMSLSEACHWYVTGPYSHVCDRAAERNWFESIIIHHLWSCPFWSLCHEFKLQHQLVSVHLSACKTVLLRSTQRILVPSPHTHLLN